MTIRSGKRGLGLGTVLVIAVLLATLGFALAGAGTSHLMLANVEANGEQALDLARTVVAQAINSLSEDEQWGTDPSQHFIAHHRKHGSGWVTFSPSEANRLGLEPSVNNLSSTSSILSRDNTVVPAQGALLVGLGEVSGVKRTVTVLLHRPDFPFAVAADGPVRLQGRALVASLESAPSESIPEPLREELQPADLLSNATSNLAVDLGAQVVVAGDVHAAGGVQFEPETVMGEVLTQQPPVPLPAIDLPRFDPQSDGRPFETLLEDSYQEGAPSVFRGSARREGSVTFHDGIELDGGLLFVTGNLGVGGIGVRGRGVVVAQGEVTITGGSNLAGDSLVALLSGGSLILRGNGTTNSSFRGLVYAGGGLLADQITVFGNLISGDPSQDLTVREAQVFQVSGSLNLTRQTPTGGNSPTFYPVYHRPFSPETTVEVTFGSDGSCTYEVTMDYPPGGPPSSTSGVLGPPSSEWREAVFDAVADFDRQVWGPSPYIGQRLYREQFNFSWDSQAPPLDDDQDPENPTEIVLFSSDLLSGPENLRIKLWRER